ncbi:MAG: peptidase C11 [Lachnospiraceae bacterium]|nr:peptidase C11 [Lachnospiraceae bacterium]
MADRPTGHQKKVISGQADIGKKGSGLGTGPVGQGSGGGFNTGGGSGGGPIRSSGGGKMLLLIIVLLVLFGGGKGLGSLFGGSGSSGNDTQNTQNTQSTQNTQATSQSQSSASSLGSLASLLGSGSYNDYYTGNQAASSGYGNILSGSVPSNEGSNTSSTRLNTDVAKEARQKRTVIKGGGKDKITIMVYMCGADLESKNGMATSDLMEMTKANISPNINLIVYTGGASRWQNSVISSSVNQVYRIRDGGLECLVKDAGTASMTNPDNLAEYIKFCKKNYPADRYDLIFWDHGGGSISGYGYDEKNRASGSMNLSGINKALKNGGTEFDFIGFDTCLMATLENALMVSQYADYLIASEETEPGVGWYYTNWLTKLSENTSMPTIDIGKNIIDDFVTVCNQKCPGQKTTLSMIDLAELEKTVPEDFKEFSQATSELINKNEYKVVSDARFSTREFAQSSKIDQIDLVDFAKKMNTPESKQLADTLLEAIKYNRTSSSISNAYGLSIYFPYKKTSSVSSAVSTYDAIGLDSEYSKCIQDFASLQLGGQVSSGYTASPVGSLMGTLLGGSTGGSYSSADMISTILGGMLTGNLGRVTGVDSKSLDFLSESSMSTDDQAEYIFNNHLDQEDLVWIKDTDGKYKLNLSDKDWDMVHSLDLNVFYDDGDGYLDLGLDNVMNYDANDNLIGEYDNTWLTVDGKLVAYYHTDDIEEGDSFATSGYIPAMLNGERVELIVVYDEANPYGYIAGANYVYKDNETDTVPKNTVPLQTGDELLFIFDHYTYDGKYEDSYTLGDPIVLGDEIELGYMDLGKDAKTRATYKLTDIYEQAYWTPVIP